MPIIGKPYGSQLSTNALLKVVFSILCYNGTVKYAIKKYICMHISVKNDSVKTVSFMNNPSGRLMKCFLRDLYMVTFMNISFLLLVYFSIHNFSFLIGYIYNYTKLFFCTIFVFKIFSEFY